MPSVAPVADTLHGVAALQFRPEQVRPSPDIPGFEILGELGRGGMGVVYKARQLRLNRVVALKMVLAGEHAQTEKLARFLTEAEAVAQLQHPNIVQIFEVGQHAGLPFCALEYVEGGSLSQKLQGSPLPPGDAAYLIETLARAMHAAHERGIIHRDLKPANILLAVSGQHSAVSQEKGEPAARLRAESFLLTAVPKIADFGLAKRVDGGAGLTRSGDIMGTPSYMAPEQAAGQGKAVGPAADIYALGAILYELLTGRPPFKAATAVETIVQVVDDEPVAPRRLQPKTPRDLETICLKCLRKQPLKRYASALALADDLSRFQEGEPILARPATAWEKVGKWARRKPATASLVGVSTVALVVLFGLILGFSFQLRASLKDAQDQRDRAEEREQEANRARQIAQAVNDFLQEDLLGQADVGRQPAAGGQGARNRDIKVRELLDRAAGRIEGKFTNQPEVEAAIRQTIGDTYQHLGEYDRAQKQMERALAWRRQNLGADHPDTLVSLRNLAFLCKEQGRYAEAEEFYRAALAGQRSRLGADHLDTLRTLNNLAELYRARGRDDEAEPLFEELLAACRAKLGADHFATIAGANNLAELYKTRGRYDAAEPLLKEALAGCRSTLGVDHPNTLTGLNNLALLYMDLGRDDEAEPLLKEVLAGRRSKMGPDHPLTLQSLKNLGMLYRGRGRFDEAEPLLTEALAGRRAKLGENHPHTLSSMDGLGLLYLDQGRYDDAEPMLKEALAQRRAQLGAAHPDTLNSMVQMAVLHQARKRSDEAAPLLQEALSRAREKPGLAHPAAQALVATAAHLYERAGKPERAEHLWRELVDAARQAAGPESPAYAGWLALLGSNLLKQNRPPEAESLLRICVPICQQKEPDAWTTFRAGSLLGGALSAQEKYAEAEALLRAGYDGLNAREKTIPLKAKTSVTEALERLVRLYEAWGKPDLAKVWRQKLELPQPPREKAAR
jgi:serine/threonine protein kinase/Tfp pilus assembly protein PilF